MARQNARSAAGRQQAPRTTPPRGGSARNRRPEDDKPKRAERAFAKGGKGAPKRGGSAPKRNQAPRVSSDRLIEGRRAVDEALSADVPIRRAFIATTPNSQDPKLARMASEFESAGIPVEFVSKAVLDRMSSHGAHQGIAIETKPYKYCELEDIIAASGTGSSLVIVLDHVTDEGNFGAIVRSAEVVGAAGVIIPKARSASVGVGAYKTSAGAVMHVNIAQVSNLAKAVDELKAAGFWVGAATEHADDLAWNAPMGGRIALVMGNEQSGVSRLVMEHTDFAVKLPVMGRVESLNVAQATTALAYEWLRQTMERDDSLVVEGADLEAVPEVVETIEVDDWSTGDSASFFFDAADIEALNE